MIIVDKEFRRPVRFGAAPAMRRPDLVVEAGLDHVRDAKVGDLQDAVRGHDEVLGLDVAVGHAALVHVLEAQQELLEQAVDLGIVEIEILQNRKYVASRTLYIER